MTKQVSSFYIVLLLCLFSRNTIASDISCHIHPPTSNNDEKPKLIGPYPSQQSCDKARLEMFGNQGRCHCSFDGVPRLNAPSQPFGNDGMNEGFRP